ncbi:MAG: glycine cleavage system protein GcvH [Anaerolineae bacterium]|nr:glycine cleavage system protein GcvH [Anaerolineae bacterium]NUQ05445.1 glycine cleavage system protein GcvH [Anaerolineae bacterium]
MANWNTPEDLKYLKSDEWIRIVGEVGTIGVSDYAQDQLNDVVFVELPEVGKALKKGDVLGVIESVKAASDLLMPVSGEVIEVNTSLKSRPDQVNADPFGSGWIAKVRITGDADNPDLMDAAAYAAYCQTR